MAPYTHPISTKTNKDSRAEGLLLQAHVSPKWKVFGSDGHIVSMGKSWLLWQNVDKERRWKIIILLSLSVIFLSSFPPLAYWIISNVPLFLCPWLFIFCLQIIFQAFKSFPSSSLILSSIRFFFSLRNLSPRDPAGVIWHSFIGGNRALPIFSRQGTGSKLSEVLALLILPLYLLLLCKLISSDAGLYRRYWQPKKARQEGDGAVGVCMQVSGQVESGDRTS